MTCNTIRCIDKALVARRFANARNTYGSEARVQQQVAEKMLRLIREYACPPAASSGIRSNASPFRRIVEFGCGTGYYSRLLLHTLQPETLLLNDLCTEMEECIKDICQPDNKGHVSFLPCDAETLDFPPGTDLITSCSTLQWFADTKHFFARCHRFLSDDGILAFSTFGKKNMQEIHALTGHGLEYLSLEQLKALLSPHFQLLYTAEETVSLPFSTPLEVLKHLKQTGVTGTEKRVWTRGRLQSFCNEYIRLCDNADHSVSLTYHPIYIITQKKA